jgi:hypothetical protein
LIWSTLLIRFFFLLFNIESRYRDCLPGLLTGAIRTDLLRLLRSIKQ